MQEFRSKRRFGWLWLPLGLLVGLPALVFGCYQLKQTIQLMLRPAMELRGVVLDQHGKPVGGMELTFTAKQIRLWLPIPFFGFDTRRTVKATTGDDGTFTVKWKEELLRLENVEKAGYSNEPETKAVVWSWGMGPPPKYGSRVEQTKLVVRREAGAR